MSRAALIAYALFCAAVLIAAQTEAGRLALALIAFGGEAG